MSTETKSAPQIKDELLKKSNFQSTNYSQKHKLGSYPSYMMHVQEHHVNQSEILVYELIKHNFSQIWSSKESVRDLNFSMQTQRTQKSIDSQHPNIQEVRDYYINAKGNFCIVMEQLDYSLQNMLNDVAELQYHVSEEEFKLLLAQQLILIKNSVQTGICYSLMEFHQTFVSNDILKVNDFRIDDYFGDERVIQNKEIHWQYNLKEVAIIMSALLTGKMLRISYDNPKEKQALKFPGISNDVANLVTLMAHKNDENALHYLKKDVIIKTMNTFFGKMQFQFESINQLISDRTIFRSQKEQFEKSIDLFNEISNEANLRNTTETLNQDLEYTTLEQETRISQIDMEIEKLDSQLEEYEKTLKNVEVKFSKIRPNLLAENEYKFKHIGKSLITSEYYEVNRMKYGPDSVDYLILNIQMSIGVHIFRIKVINQNGYFCIVGDLDLPCDPKSVENYCSLGTVFAQNIETQNEAPFFKDGDMLEIELDCGNKIVKFYDVQKSKVLLAKATLDFITCDYQRICFGLLQCKSKFKVVDQFIKEEN